MEILKKALEGDLQGAALESTISGEQIPLDAPIMTQQFYKQQNFAVLQNQNATFRQVTEFTNSVFKTKCTFARFTGGGKFIVSGSDDNCVKLLELQRARQDNIYRQVNQRGNDQLQRFRHTFYGHNGGVTDAVVHQSYELMASASLDTDIRLFNLQSPETESLILSRTAGYGVCSLDFIAQFLAAAPNAECGQILLMNLQKYDQYLNRFKAPNSYAFSKIRAFENLVFASNTTSVNVLDPRSGQFVHYNIQNLTDFAPISEYTFLYSTSQGGGVFDCRNNQPVISLPDLKVSCGTMFYNNFLLGLNDSGRAVVYDSKGKQLTYEASRAQQARPLTQRHQMVSIEGSGVEKCCCYIWDRSYAVSDFD